MKKLFLMASAVVLLASCGGSKAENEQNKDEKKADSAAKPAAKAVATTGEGLRIAFVEVDSIMTQYEFCKEYSDKLAEEYTKIQKELAGKQRTLEQHAASVQSKYETGVYSTREELERAQNTIVREQQELAQYSDKRTAEFAELQQKYDKAFHDSIQSFINDYNSKEGYDYILSKGGDNMLYANPAYDITEEIVSGLNKRYKKAK